MSIFPDILLFFHKTKIKKSKMSIFPDILLFSKVVKCTLLFTFDICSQKYFLARTIRIARLNQTGRVFKNLCISDHTAKDIDMMKPLIEFCWFASYVGSAFCSVSEYCT